MKLEKGLYVRSDKGFISQINEFIKHYTKGKRLVTSSSVKEVDENYLSLKGNQCEFIDSIDCFIPPCYPSDEEIEKIKRHIVKASFNIIDLIEVGDYVNGKRIIALRKDIEERNIHFNSKKCNIFTDYSLPENWYFGIENKDIKSIVTRQQFEQMSYKVNNER